jgi:hypothetical protein
VVGHASVLKDILSVLTLVQEEVVMSLLHEDSQKVVEGTRVLHGKLQLGGGGGCSGMLQKLKA